MISEAEQRAMRMALGLAASDGAPVCGANPRVGSVILAPGGEVIGRGFHRGPGTPHAEVAALTEAGAAARGATAVVTLEPCNHTGRTGPCSQALIAAGVRRVVYGQSDPNPLASGGAETLRSAGVEVAGGLLADEALALNPGWSLSMARGRPFVILKLAATLDGRIAAADGTSRWITGPQARADVHELRSRVDAVLVGTGTVIADDPQLTDRRPGAARQPTRVVLGLRDLPPGARVLDGTAETILLRTRDLSDALRELHEADLHQVLVEGGAAVAAAFLRAGAVDQLRWYAAPKLLGGGPLAVGGLGIDTVSQALRFQVEAVRQVGSDVRIDLRPDAGSDNSAGHGPEPLPTPTLGAGLES